MGIWLGAALIGVAGFRTLAVMAVVTVGAAAYLLSRPEQRAANHPAIVSRSRRERLVPRHVKAQRLGTGRGHGDISFATEMSRA